MSGNSSFGIKSRNEVIRGNLGTEACVFESLNNKTQTVTGGSSCRWILLDAKNGGGGVMIDS